MKLQLSAAVALFLLTVVDGAALVAAWGGTLHSVSLQPSISAGCRVLICGSNLASSSITVTAETLIDGRSPCRWVV